MGVRGGRRGNDCERGRPVHLLPQARLALTPARGASEPPRRIAVLLRAQQRWCERLGSPLYAALLGNAADDAERRGPTWEVLEAHVEDPPASALALRLMGSVHRLVLAGKAPELQSFYPSAGGARSERDAWPAFRSVVERCADELRDLIRRPVQTNEPGRSASLLGGMLVIGAETGLPLRLLEVGASAGLNLRPDHYRYDVGGRVIGDASSAVRFTEPFEGGAPPLDAPLEVVERRGCDADPVDPSTEEGRLTLQSYVWADQSERLRLLRAAQEVAARVPVAVDRDDAVAWVARRLAEPAPGIATVVFHSIVAQYLGSEGRARLKEVLEGAGARAQPAGRPLAWLRLEPSDVERGGGTFELRLTIWPGGAERLLATAHPHGTPVRWHVG